MDLIIEKKNETHLLLYAEPSLLYELQDKFTFFAEGYKFHPRYKAKLWDGKLRLLKIISSNRGEVYFGLINQIISFCKERNYTFKLSDNLRFNPDSELLINTFDNTIKEFFKNSKIEVRDYQSIGFKSSISKKRQLILSPTSSGKSFMVYMIAKYLLEQGLRGLIIVPTISLVHQLTDNFDEYSQIDGYNINELIHKIFTGQDKNSNKLLTISTWQSLHQIKSKEYFEKYDFVFVDEVHNAKASSLTNILEKCINASYRIGLTGTLDGLKINEKTLIGLFGPVNKLISTKELIDRKQIANLKIKCLVLKHTEENCKLLKKAKYQDEIKYLIKNNTRNIFIKNLAFSLKKNTIILFNFVETHGKVLYEMLLNSPERNGRNIYFIHGGIDGEERELIRKIMETENDAIIVASYGTMSTGISINNLHYIIYSISGKSRIRNLQSIGRILRLHSQKDYATLFDIVDDLSIGKHKNFSLQHFIERIKIYDQEQFEYSLHKINLPNK